MAGHGLGGADRQLVGVVAEHRLDGVGLAGVVEGGGGAVGVDVAHLLGGHAAVGQGLGHGPGAALPVGGGGSHVVGVAGGAVAHHLGVHLGPTGLGVFVLLQHQDAGALAHHKAGTLGVKGDGGPVGVVPHMEGPHGGEAADGQGGDGGLGAAAQHHLGIAVPDVAEGVAHGVGAAGAGGDGAGTHTLEAEGDGDEAGSHVGDGGGDVKGRGPVKALLRAAHLLGLGVADAADAAGDDDAAAGAVDGLQIQTAVGHRLLGGGHSQLGVAGHVAHFLLIQHGGGVPVLYLGGQMDLLRGGVVLGDGGDAAHAVADGLPGVGHVVAQGIHGPHAGNDDSAFFHS